MTHNAAMSMRYAKINKKLAYEHRHADPEFAEQWLEAEAYALELLHGRVWQRAMEGDCEPVLYMGVPVAYIRKFDSKLQIEMLRAYMPDRFKTPGHGQVTVNTGPSLLVLTEEDRAKLIEARREALALMPGPDETSADSQFVSVAPQ